MHISYNVDMYGRVCSYFAHMASRRQAPSGWSYDKVRNNNTVAQQSYMALGLPQNLVAIGRFGLGWATPQSA